MYRLIAAVLLVLAFGPAAQAQSGLKLPNVTPEYRPTCPQDIQVWVNSRSGFYHRPGSSYYGHTATGEFMCKKAADKAGFKETPYND